VCVNQSVNLSNTTVACWMCVAWSTHLLRRSASHWTQCNSVTLSGTMCLCSIAAPEYVIPVWVNHVWIITSVRHSVNQRSMVVTVGAGYALWRFVGVALETVVDIIGEWCYTIGGWGRPTAQMCAPAYVVL